MSGPFAQPSFKTLTECTAAEVGGTINMNARFMAHVMRILLPNLTHNGPSLIFNMSSGADLGMPWLSMYSAVKGFKSSINRAVSGEAIGIDAAFDNVVLYPGDVQSQANVQGPALFFPDREKLRKHGT
jgi:17beta-estradiol 17-dehydrogenase / very-long-chain 3-oxoacyl-CoA reductase